MLVYHALNAWLSSEMAMEKIKVLFVSVKNSARGQMAEAFLRAFGGKKFHVESAGLEPDRINQLAVDVMKEMGIDISSNTTKSIFGLYQQGKLFNYIISLCDEESLQRCPLYPHHIVKHILWPFEDPEYFIGTYEERLEKTRVVRNQIREKVKEFIQKTSDNAAQTI